MTLIRVCGRCGAAVGTPLDGTPRNINIPATSPASCAMSKDAIVSIGVNAPGDLCGPCLLSALVEFALAGAAGSLTPALVAALQARINAALPVA